MEGTSETLESDPLPNDLLKRSYNKLIKNLERDGFAYADGKITTTATSKVDFAHDAVDLCDANQFREYVDRINASIDVDPVLAIGSTKELVESVLKTILQRRVTSSIRTMTFQNFLERYRNVWGLYLMISTVP